MKQTKMKTLNWRKAVGAVAFTAMAFGITGPGFAATYDYSHTAKVVGGDMTISDWNLVSDALDGLQYDDGATNDLWGFGTAPQSTYSISTALGIDIATQGLNVQAGGAAITGNSTVTGTFDVDGAATATSYTSDAAITAGTGLTVTTGGAGITGNSTVTGTFDVDGAATATSYASDAAITAGTGLTVTTGGATISAGGLTIGTTLNSAAGFGALLGFDPSNTASLAATNVQGAIDEVVADYALTSNGNGAALIGIEDSAGDLTATTVEGALAELAANNLPSGSVTNSVVTWDGSNWTEQVGILASADQISSGTLNTTLTLVGNGTAGVAVADAFDVDGAATATSYASDAAISSGTTMTAGTGLTVTTGGAGITGNSSVTGTFDVDGAATATSYASDAAITAGTGLTVTTGGLLVSAGGADISGTVALDLGSDATGDVFYRDGSGNVARLGMGTAGQVLKTNTGATAPEWGSATAETLDLAPVTLGTCTTANTGEVKYAETGSAGTFNLEGEMYGCIASGGNGVDTQNYNWVVLTIFAS